MALVVVERTFEQPGDFGALEARERDGAWCLEQLNVSYVRTWFSADRRQMVCLYDAPDARLRNEALTRDGCDARGAGASR